MSTVRDDDGDAPTVHPERRMRDRDASGYFTPVADPAPESMHR